MPNIRDAILAATASGAHRQALRSIGDEQLEQQPAAVSAEAIVIRVAELIDHRQQQPQGKPAQRGRRMKFHDVERAMKQLPARMASKMIGDGHPDAEAVVREAVTAKPARLARLLLQLELLEGIAWQSRKCARSTKALETMISRVRKKQREAMRSLHPSAEAEDDCDEQAAADRDRLTAQRDFVSQRRGAIARIDPRTVGRLKPR